MAIDDPRATLAALRARHGHMHAPTFSCITCDALAALAQCVEERDDHEQWVCSSLAVRHRLEAENARLAAELAAAENDKRGMDEHHRRTLAGHAAEIAKLRVETAALVATVWELLDAEWPSGCPVGAASHWTDVVAALHDTESVARQHDAALVERCAQVAEAWELPGIADAIRCLVTPEGK